FTGALRVWEMRDLPAPVKEDLAPPPEDEAATLGINLLPPPGGGVVTAAFPDWVSVSRWYDELSRGRSGVTPAIQSASREGVPAGSPGPLDKIVAASMLVRNRVRYVAV